MKYRPDAVVGPQRPLSFHPLRVVCLLGLLAILGLVWTTGIGAASASARDIVIGDSSSPLDAGGGAGGNFAGTAVAAGSPAATQNGSCSTPNVSIRPSSSDVTTPASTRQAIQKAVNPTVMGIQGGDSLLFCDISGSNTYAPAISAPGSRQAIDLSGSPGITISAFPGQNPTLQANQADENHSFFVDNSSQGRSFTISGLSLRQAATTSATVDGGFIRISNSVAPGTLTLKDVNATGFFTTGAGGVVRAENVNLDDVTLGEAKANAADGVPLYGNAAESNVAVGGGGGIYAEGNVTVTGLNANNNIVGGDAVAGAAGNGGAIFAGGNTGAGNVTLTGVPSNFQKNVNDDPNPGTSGNGGAIAAAGTVSIQNASVFGGQPLATNSLGGNFSQAGRGGAISARVLETGPQASFIRNRAINGSGGAISANGVQIDGTGASGPQFLGNSADGGGAIAILGGTFTGAGTTAEPRVCATPSAITNVTFGNNTDNSATNAGSNSASGPGGGSLGGGAIRIAQEATDNAPSGPAPNTTKKCPVDLSGTDFNGNIAGSGGGGAVLAAGGAITTSATTRFRNNDAGNTATLAAQAWGAGNGGAINATATRETTLTVPAVAFSANQAGGDGGAVSLEASASSTFTGTSFTNNNAANRPAAADDRGGAIAVQPVGTPGVSINGGTFVNNAVAASGAGDLDTAGAVALLAGTSTITDSTFTNNNAAALGSGGALEIANNASVTKSVFNGNRAGTTSGNGGAIRVSGGTPSIQENTFSGNRASGTDGGSGGAIYATTSLGVTPVGSLGKNVFADNLATTVGGAILHQGLGSLTLQEDTFRGNYAGDAGGAVISTSGTLTVEKAYFERNSSRGNGGALLGSGPGATVLRETEFLRNRAGVDQSGNYVTAGSGADGGAVSISSGTYRIEDSAFRENAAANDGGALVIASDGSAAGDGIVSSDFSQNEAGKANAAQQSVGGAVSLQGAFTQEVTGSEFLSNRVAQTNTAAAATTRGGAIAATGGNLNLARSTVAGNSASSGAAVAPGGVAAAGGGVYLASGHTVTSTNSTFTANQAPVAAVAWSENTAGALAFTSSTIADNDAPGGSSILVSGRTSAGAINLANSVLAESQADGSACLTGTGGTLVNSGGNVLTDTTACGGDAFIGGGGAPAVKVTGSQLALGPLADNGGPTETMAISLASAAADSAAVNALGPNPTDQRGLPRPTTDQSSGAYQLVTGEISVSKAGSGQGTITSVPAGIDCGETCRAAVALDADPGQVTLTATAARGSVFQSWTGTCESVSGNLCVVEVGRDGLVSVTANFRDASRSLTVSQAGNGEGRITSGEGGPIDCGTRCVAQLEQGSTITLTAEPLGNSAFGGWSGACSAAGVSPTCTLTMDTAKNVTATFTQTARARINWNNDEFRVPKNRTINVGQVTCVNGRCTVVQATARIKLQGKTYRAKVQVNRNTFTTGQKRAIKVLVPKAVYRRLQKGRNSGKLGLVVRAEASVPSSFIEVNRSLSAFLRR